MTKYKQKRIIINNCEQLINVLSMFTIQVQNCNKRLIKIDKKLTKAEKPKSKVMEEMNFPLHTTEEMKIFNEMLGAKTQFKNKFNLLYF